VCQLSLFSQYINQPKLFIMKKLLFAFAAVAILTSVTSCKKCGFCKYANGSTSDAVCKNTTLSALGVDEYSQAEAQCSADGGVWQKK